MDFFTPVIHNKKGLPCIKANFLSRPSSDFMTRGGAFYAVYNPETHFWSRNEFDVELLVDGEIETMRKSLGEGYLASYLRDSVSGAWAEYRAWLHNQPDSWVQLDQSLKWLNDELTIHDFATKTLPYPLIDGPHDAWDELVNKLYSPLERQKIEWAIGSIVSGDSTKLQKFFVFYGGIGTGKSTILNIIKELFQGYWAPVDVAAMGTRSDQFALEALKDNPLVGIDDDADLRRIETNGTINSLTSHASLVVNEKHKSRYAMQFHTMLFLGTNQPVRISDAKSGLIRRLIDIVPTGETFPADEYFKLINQIHFELGAIAHHCLKVYKELGSHHYDHYRPLVMMYNTDSFFNFVEEYYPIFSEQNGCTLKQAYMLYKEYVDEGGLEFTLPKYKFREQLKDYFDTFEEDGRWEGRHQRCVYTGFKKDVFTPSEEQSPAPSTAPLLDLSAEHSLLDDYLAACPAQYATDDGKPSRTWSKVTTFLRDIDTSKVHYVLQPHELITIDFDLKDATGNKSFELNAAEAIKWPKTYAELSKGGEGIHLEYIYDGDTSKLAADYAPGIEIKVRRGHSSLRRRVSKCNDVPIAHLAEGSLPFKKEKKKVYSETVFQSEKGLRSFIEKNLRKEYHAHTTPSVQFIKKGLDEAYSTGLVYDVEDLHDKVLSFALKSHNQSEFCARLVTQMHFKSDIEAPPVEFPSNDVIYFFDVEVFPNLFVLCYKALGADETISLINPTASDVQEFCKRKLVGFNCRRYDNHILYARMLGFDNLALYDISQRIISGDKTAFFREAYSLSYTDIYDFSVLKQSLKRFEIDLGIHHHELGLPWDLPVAENLWEEVADYCKDDVEATETTFLSRAEDWAARQVLAQLSGLTLNDITSAHMAKILFGDDPNPQDKFVYTDLRTIFPKYEFRNGKTYYDGKEYGEGGLAVSCPGTYTNVPLLDIASMHPTSLIELNYFGPYTQRFKEFVEARLAVKHGDVDALHGLLGGALMPFVGDANQMKALAYALKICINQVYGLTSAKFPNKFKDPRNVDNIVAKRGELFMLSLIEQLEPEQEWIHVKTDSIKLAYNSPDLIQFVVDYGHKYGYTFELEAVYDRLCIIDKTNYVALGESGEHAGEWVATGKTFSRPYPFKTIFTHKPIGIDDVSETMGVHTGRGIYRIPQMVLDAMPEGADEYQYILDNAKFVGRVGRFTPVKHGGEVLLREADGKFAALAGSKGYEWVETETLDALHLNRDDVVDESYYQLQVDECKRQIAVHSEYALGQPPDDVPTELVEAAVNVFVNGTKDEVSSKLETGLPF